MKEPEILARISGFLHKNPLLILDCKRKPIYVILKLENVPSHKNISPERT